MALDASTDEISFLEKYQFLLEDTPKATDLLINPNKWDDDDDDEDEVTGGNTAKVM